MKKYRNGKPVSMTMPNRFVGRATLRFRLLRAKLTSNKYVYPDDIRQMRKTTKLIKWASKYRRSIIITANYNFKRVIEAQIRNHKGKHRPLVVSVKDLTSLHLYKDVDKDSKVFIEEAISYEDICEFFRTYRKLLDRVELSYSPIPTKEEMDLYIEHKRHRNICDAIGMDAEELTFSIGEIYNAKKGN